MNESRPNGFPGQQPEQAPQTRVPNSPERDRRGQGEEGPPAQGGSESTLMQPERQPLPSALDVLERKAQLYESDLWRRIRRVDDGRRKENRALFKEFRAAEERIGKELATLYALTTSRERLIIDVYTTLLQTPNHRGIYWSSNLSPDDTRQFISRVAPMSEDELREELRKAQETLERKAEVQRKRVEYSLLPPEEAARRRREDRREHARNYQKRRKERARLRAEQHQPTQVFPPSTQQ